MEFSKPVKQLNEIPSADEKSGISVGRMLAAGRQPYDSIRKLGFLGRIRPWISINEIRLQSAAIRQRRLVFCTIYTLLVGGKPKLYDQPSQGSSVESSPGDSPRGHPFKGQLWQNIFPILESVYHLTSMDCALRRFKKSASIPLQHLRQLDLNLVLSKTTAWKSSENQTKPKPDVSNLNSLNSWLSKRKIAKTWTSTRVYSLFFQAKKILTGIEEEATEDSF